jgi:hypothetical protein
MIKYTIIFPALLLLGACMPQVESEKKEEPKKIERQVNIVVKPVPKVQM